MREIKKNTMYKHFKGNYYFTLGVSKPKSDLKMIGTYKFVRVTNTETNEMFDVLINLETGNFIHNKDIIDKKLVIYRAAYLNNDIIWARELDMFASEVDKEKYPEFAGQNRFEEVK